MTREEAIEILMWVFYKIRRIDSENIYDTPPTEEEIKQAGNMAIEALEQEPCEDATSRQDVLDLAKKGVLVSNGNYKSVCKAINELPPVNPQPKTGHWIDDEFGSKCSCCGIHTHLDKFDRPMKFKHCSMCGAKMVELQESKGKE